MKYESDLLAVLRRKPPRRPYDVRRLVSALKPHVRTAPTARETSVGVLAGTAVAALTGSVIAVLPATLVFAELPSLWRRRWTRRLARDGVMLEGDVVREADLTTLVLSFDLAGAHTTARVKTRTISDSFEGHVYLLCLPDARPRYVHVFGPDGPVPFRLDPIVMPSAKLLR